MKEYELTKLLNIIHKTSCINNCSHRDCCENVHLCIPRPCCKLIRSSDKDIREKITSNIVLYFKNNNKAFDLFIELFSNEELLSEIYFNKDEE